ncbi:hypothetical protein L1D32_01315 [Shewanella insulae]|uniref:hypothetical protein n=1 Tax=Shewanella insulae TaxID=2681496 RepID=UPI001EFDA980|nr:hypothetical protein [Shewanella insulae]MCG9736799.1 hypothetical protein [Shewanella insulae]
MTPPDAYLTRVLEILNAPITMEAIREYHAIAKAAKGDEAWMIDDLFEALFVATSSDEALFHQAIAEGLL